SIRTPNKKLLFNSFTYDTINIPGNVPLSGIELFLSAAQENIHSLTVTLKAPNGLERTVLASSGGIGGNVLTFFADGAPSVMTFTNPWSHIAAPNQSFGNFGNSNSGGNWILKLNNAGSTTAGTLLGWGLRINNSITGIQTVSNNVPSEFKLYQNYPNPFNPETNIKFDIPGDAEVKIAVYDMLGREVQVIANEFKIAGSYEMSFDASHLSSGTYFYKLTAGSLTDIKKMVLIK
ncbi:MAG: T9SS type A sorting domain-containing protein, partial [Ignavibacteria bacterium]|nr:T9SS type A sorting domain-containing protein [Ignavibacteria bacterium]